MLSIQEAMTGFVNIFNVTPESMQYDIVAMRADIEEYGLFTYEEFAAIVPVPEEIFEAFSGQYLKATISKWVISREGIKALVSRYEYFF